jgi:hypothetical protein
MFFSVSDRIIKNIQSMHLNSQIERIQDKIKYPLLFKNRCVAYYNFFAEEFNILNFSITPFTYFTCRALGN